MATAIAAMMAIGIVVVHGAVVTPVNDFGSVAVGSPSTSLTITVTGTPGTTAKSVQLDTKGAPGQPDYTDAGGGTCVSGFAFSAGTPTCTVNVKFAPQFPGQRNGSVTVLDSSNAVLGSTNITGIGTSPQIAFTPATVSTLGNGVRIAGAAVDGAENGGQNGYVSVPDTHQIFKSTAGGPPAVFAGNKTAGLVNGPVLTAEFNAPTGVAIDGAGNIYIADTGNNVLRKISSGQVSTIAGPGVSTTLGDGGAALSAYVNAPTAIAVDGFGNVYFDDSGNARLRRIDAATGIITTVAGTGTQGFAGDGGLGTAAGAEIGLSNGIAIDAAGKIFFTDQTSNVIRELDAGGTLHTVAGMAGTSGSSGDGGFATSAKLSGPMGIALDASGAIYFTDSGNSVVRRIDAGGKISTVAGVNGTAGASADGLSTLAAFKAPAALAINSAGDLLIADPANFFVRPVRVGAVPAIKIPDTETGRASVTQSFTVYNTGNRDLNFSALTTTADYSLLPSSTCAVGTPVTAGLSCQLDVAVTPVAVGNDNGSLTVASDSLNGTASTTISFTTNAIPAPVALVITGPPATPIKAGGNPGTVTVQEQDAGGKIVTSANDSILLFIPGPQGFGTILNAVNGIATFDLSGNAFNVTGTYTYTASTRGVTPQLTSPSVNEVVTAGPPSKIAVTVPTSVVAGGSLGVITATIQDSLGNTVTASSATVTAAVTGAGGYSASFTSPAATNGVVSVDLTGLPPLNTAGTYSVTFTSSDAPPATSGAKAFTVTVGPAAKFTVGGVTTPITAGGNEGSITAAVTDAQGNPVTTSTAQFTATITGPNGFTFTSAPTNAASGVATINLSTAALNTSGAYSVTVVSTGLTGPPASSVTVNAGATTKVIASAVPTTLTAGAAVGNVTITTQDQFGNTSPFNGPATVTVTGPTGPNSTGVPYSGTVNNGTLTIPATGALNMAGAYSVAATADTFSSTPQTVTVSAAAASKTIASAVPPTLTAGQAIGNVTVTVEDKFGNPVTSFNGAANVTVTGPGAGGATVSYSATAANGTTTVNANGAINTAGGYTVAVSADGFNAVAQTVTVNPGAATNFTITPIPTALNAGGNLGTITATIKDGLGNTVTTSAAPVTVSISGPGGFTGGGTANAQSGVATINLAGTPLDTAGTYTVTVMSANLTGPPATNVLVSATLPAAFLSVSGFPTTISAGGTGMVTVTVQDQFRNTILSGFTGTVTLSSSDPAAVFTPQSFTYTNADAGVHAFSVMLDTAGTQSITANTAGATGSQPGIVVGQTTTTAALTLTPGGGGSDFGIAESLTATISPASDGSVKAAGTVQFKDNGTAVGTPVTIANGTARLNLMFPAPGSHSYTATYTGDANFAGSNSDPVPFVVAQAATVTTLTSSGTPSLQGAQVTFTATVAGLNGGTPTGTVTFFDGTTMLGTGQLAGGMTTFQATFNTNGPHSITAVYGGDVNFTGSTSAAFVQSVTPAFTFSVNPDSLTLRSGETGFVALTVSGQGGFNGLVNLSCGNLPSTMECTFFPSTIGVNGNSQEIEIVIKTRGNFGSLNATNNAPGGSNAPVFPALAFWMPGAALGGFGLRRKNMNGRKRQALLLIVLTLGMGGLLGLAGCGSGDGPKTPAGTYNITVTGTSGTLVNSVPLTVVIR